MKIRFPLFTDDPKIKYPFPGANRVDSRERGGRMQDSRRPVVRGKIAQVRLFFLTNLPDSVRVPLAREGYVR